MSVRAAPRRGAGGGRRATTEPRLSQATTSSCVAALSGVASWTSARTRGASCPPARCGSGGGRPCLPDAPAPARSQGAEEVSAGRLLRPRSAEPHVPSVVTAGYRPATCLPARAGALQAGRGHPQWPPSGVLACPWQQGAGQALPCCVCLNLGGREGSVGPHPPC